MENTVIPGIKIDSEKTKEIFVRFRNHFRASDRMYSDNAPTSGLLVPPVKEDEDAFSNTKFLNLKEVYLLLDPWKKLYLAKPHEVLSYYVNPEREYFDFCVFDKTFLWCIGATHNEQVVVVDPNGIVSD